MYPVYPPHIQGTYLIQVAGVRLRSSLCIIEHARIFFHSDLQAVMAISSIEAKGSPAPTARRPRMSYLPLPDIPDSTIIPNPDVNDDGPMHRKGEPRTAGFWRWRANAMEMNWKRKRESAGTYCCVDDVPIRNSKKSKTTCNGSTGDKSGAGSEIDNATTSLFSTWGYAPFCSYIENHPVYKPLFPDMSPHVTPSMLKSHQTAEYWILAFNDAKLRPLAAACVDHVTNC